MLLDSCDGAGWPRLMEELRPAATFVFLGGAFLYGKAFDGRWRHACYPAWDQMFESNLSRRLGDVANGNGRVAPIWVMTVPYPLGPYDSARVRAEVDCINASIRRACATAAGVRLLDFADLLCPAGRCPQEREGTALRPDGVHFDVEAARSVARELLAQVGR